MLRLWKSRRQINEAFPHRLKHRQPFFLLHRVLQPLYQPWKQVIQLQINQIPAIDPYQPALGIVLPIAPQRQPARLHLRLLPSVSLHLVEPGRDDRDDLKHSLQIAIDDVLLLDQFLGDPAENHVLDALLGVVAEDEAFDGDPEIVEGQGCGVLLVDDPGLLEDVVHELLAQDQVAFADLGDLVAELDQVNSEVCGQLVLENVLGEDLVEEFCELAFGHGGEDLEVGFEEMVVDVLEGLAVVLGGFLDVDLGLLGGFAGDDAFLTEGVEMVLGGAGGGGQGGDFVEVGRVGVLNLVGDLLLDKGVLGVEEYEDFLFSGIGFDDLFKDGVVNGTANYFNNEFKGF